jgi:hypothetical protein
VRPTSLVFLSLTLTVAARTHAASEADKSRCAAYAQRAVQQYQLMKSNPQCQQNTDPMNWQDNYDNHYNACLIFPSKMAEMADAARQNHLIACGAVSVGGAATQASQAAAPSTGGGTPPAASPTPSAAAQAGPATQSQPATNAAAPVKGASQPATTAKPATDAKSKSQDHSLTPGG